MFIERKKALADLSVILAVVSALTIIGLLFIYSASSVYALEKFGSSHYFLTKQLFGAILGILALFIIRWIPLEIIKKTTPILFLGSLLLTLMTFIPGLASRIHGSSRWINIAGFSFQPSELLKMSVVLYLAYLLNKQINTPQKLRYIPCILITLVSCLVLLKQPDFGAAVTVGTTALFMLCAIQLSLKAILATMTTATPILFLLVYLKPYRWQRITTFLNPWQDPKGAGFQIIQSLIAIGSGNWWGTGISHSKQKFFYLPMQHTDFIFAIIAEETGFIGATLLIFLYSILLYFGIRLAWRMKDAFCSIATLGFIFLLNLQAIINLAVTTGLLPTKGISLPFVSYGSSALLVNLCIIGCIINFAQEAEL